MNRPRPARLAAFALATALVALTAAAPATARPHGSGSLPTVTPRAETSTLYDDETGGNANADDPAIWRDPADPDRSLVVATAKEGGLRVYDLKARQVQSVPAPPAPGPDDAPGRFNNVDLVHGLRTSSGRADYAVTTDRGHDRLRVYRIDRDRPGGPLADVTDPSAPTVFSTGQDEVNEQQTAYGLATWTDKASGRSYALVSRRNRTGVALLELTAGSHGTVGYRKVRILDLPSSFRLPNGSSWSPCGEPGELPQVEGMVVDPANGTLYRRPGGRRHLADARRSHRQARTRRQGPRVRRPGHVRRGDRGVRRGRRPRLRRLARRRRRRGPDAAHRGRGRRLRPRLQPG